MENLTKETFKEKIFNYDESNAWSFEGNKPAIIDFYADWCGPCKMVAPILEELAKEYVDQIDIYKINIEEQHELAGITGIKSIPTLLFIPKDDQPQMISGAISKQQFIDMFAELFDI